MLMIHVVMMVVLIVMGIQFCSGKGAFLISGYSSASQEERERSDVRRMTLFTGKIMFVLAACWAVMAASALFDIGALLWVGMILFAAVVIGAVAYASVSPKFKAE